MAGSWEAVPDILELLTICRTTVDSQNGETKKRQLAQDFKEIAIRQHLDLSQPHKLLFGTSFNPLFEACRSGNSHIIELFVTSGANLNVLDAEGRSPLYTAISSHRNSHEIIAQLLHWGASVNFHSDGRCPLLAAFYCMKHETAKLLIKHGADVNNVILPSFCYVESVFTLNSNLVMMASGVRFSLTSFTELVSLGYDILGAGLHPRTFFLSGKSLLFKGFSTKELEALWKFQHTCLALGFKVDRDSLSCARQFILESINRVTDQGKKIWMRDRVDKLNWIENFVSQPLPLTYLARVAIRGHLVMPRIGPESHIHSKIQKLPIPKMCKDFLTLKHSDIKDVIE